MIEISFPSLEKYVRREFGENARLLEAGDIGSLDEQGMKGFGYGKPVRLRFERDGQVEEVVLSTMKGDKYGHQYYWDRAHVLLFQYETSARLERHVKPVGVGYVDGSGELVPLHGPQEFFIVNEKLEGYDYFHDLDRIRQGDFRPSDVEMARELARWLVRIHATKKNDRDLYYRRIRNLIGADECIYGLIDEAFPLPFEFFPSECFRALEKRIVDWRWRLKEKTHRLSTVHGDFHPWNVLVDGHGGFRVLDRSRGEWGEPAGDVATMAINYLLFGLYDTARLGGPFETLYRAYFEEYLSLSRDREMLETIAPFFVFRCLVIASPEWYPDHPPQVREGLLRFLVNVLEDRSFDWENVNKYMEQATHMQGKGWALWFTGLPGSGKSTLIDVVRRTVDPMQERTVLLRMDERRKAYFPNPTYSEAEREQAYKMFVDEAAFYVLSGKGVFMDATAHRLSMRRKARQLIPRFAEVYLRCDLRTAMQRESGRPEGAVMAGLYSKALERKRTGRAVKGLGEVIGVDVLFEEDPAAECVVQADTMTLEEARDFVLEFIIRWLPGQPCRSHGRAPGPEAGFHNRRAMQFHIITFGCQMNAADSIWLARSLTAMGWEEVSEDEAQVFILNTCSVREKPEQKVYSQLGRLRPLVGKHPGAFVAVGGCVAQQVGCEFWKRFPFVRLVFGTDGVGNAPQAMARLAANPELRISLLDFSETYLERELPEFITKAPAQAFVTIMQGCDNFCAYCIVPYVRGRQKSRSSADILAECRTLVAAGAREITLLGQNVNSYGLDKSGDGTSFAQLLHQVAAIDGMERLRFTTSHPKDIAPEVIRAFGELPELCPYLHLPLQSGSDRILASMGRKYDCARYLKIVDELRAVRPDIALSTDIIVGFPGEDDADFQQTMDMLERVRYEGSYSFKYNDRPGVRSVRMEPKVAEEVKSERLERFQAAQNAITEQIHKSLEGGRAEVLLERPTRKPVEGCPGWTGHDLYNRVINVPAGEENGSPDLTGTLAHVTITRGRRHFLIAKRMGQHD